MLRLVTGRAPATPFQKTFARAGHAHAGVLVSLALITQILVDATTLAEPLASIAGAVCPGRDPLPGRLLPVVDGPRTDCAERTDRASVRGCRVARAGRRGARDRPAQLTVATTRLAAVIPASRLEIAAARSSTSCSVAGVAIAPMPRGARWKPSTSSPRNSVWAAVRPPSPSSVGPLNTGRARRRRRDPGVESARGDVVREPPTQAVAQRRDVLVSIRRQLAQRREAAVAATGLPLNVPP